MNNNIFIVIITILICLIIFILIIICICYLFKKTSIQNQHINSTEMGKTKNKEGNIPNSNIIIEEQYVFVLFLFFLDKTTIQNKPNKC